MKKTNRKHETFLIILFAVICYIIGVCVLDFMMYILEIGYPVTLLIFVSYGLLLILFFLPILFNYWKK